MVSLLVGCVFELPLVDSRDLNVCHKGLDPSSYKSRSLVIEWFRHSIKYSMASLGHITFCVYLFVCLFKRNPSQSHNIVLFIYVCISLLLVLITSVCFALGMDCTQQETSPFNLSLFSPLPPKQALDEGSDVTTKSPQMEVPESPMGHDHAPGGSLTCINRSSLSPLTISAKDIEGGSMDCTEFCTGSLSFSDGDIKTTMRGSKEGPSVGKPLTSVGEGPGNLITPPRGTSSPSVPVRVRVSASKLREIQSPHSSISSRNVSAVTDHSESDDSSFQAQGNITKGLSQPPMETKNPSHRTSLPTGIRKLYIHNIMKYSTCENLQFPSCFIIATCKNGLSLLYSIYKEIVLHDHWLL